MTRYGAWSMLPSRLALEALARSGANFVGIDTQHGAHGFEDVVYALQLLDVLGIESLVRVSEQDLGMIPRYLDFAAGGVLVGMVRDAETVSHAVSLARYQPTGIRSYGGRRYGLSHEPELLSGVQPRVFVMVETVPALERLEEIVAVPGLTGVFVGPVDLSLAFGRDGTIVRRLSEVPPGFGDPPAADEEELVAWFAGAMARVVSVAHAAGVEAATFALAAPDAGYWAAHGFDRVVIASDVALLRQGIAREFAAVTGEAAGGSTAYGGMGQNDGGVTAASA